MEDDIAAVTLLVGPAVAVAAPACFKDGQRALPAKAKAWPAAGRNSIFDSYPRNL
jgi:hypothetical protein